MAENIFTELYNRVLSLFGQSVQKAENTKDVACNRLRVVLMQDRTNLTPELLERMRKELVELLSKYVEMDKDALELNFEQEGEQMALMLSIPVVRAKDEEEIEAALKAADEKLKPERETDTTEELDSDTEETDETAETESLTEEEAEKNSEDFEEEAIEEETSSDKDEVSENSQSKVEDVEFKGIKKKNK